MVYSIIYWAFLHPWVVEYHLMGSTLGKVSLYFLFISSDLCFLCPNLVYYLAHWVLRLVCRLLLPVYWFFTVFLFLLPVSFLSVLLVPACFLSALSCHLPSCCLLCCSMVLLPCFSFICCLILYIAFSPAFYADLLFFICLSPQIVCSFPRF